MCGLRILVATLMLASGCAGAGAGRPPPAGAATASASHEHTSAAPNWAKVASSEDSESYTFNCQGEGTTTQEATDAAAAFCNDQICKLCGVLVESVVETKETLAGVEMQRTVQERCRRVRTHPLEPAYSAQNCGPSGCQAWLQVRYSKADEARECRTYADDNFADPAACERAMEAFTQVKGTKAADFIVRRQLLDDALSACAEIDVRPTPLLETLNHQLQVGLSVELESLQDGDNFVPAFMEGHVRHGQSPPRSDKPLRAALLERWAENLQTLRALLVREFYQPGVLGSLYEIKTFTGRIRVVRDLMDRTARVFTTFEAFLVQELDSKQTEKTLLAALRAVRNEPDVHLVTARQLALRQVNLPAVTTFLIATYPPGQSPFAEDIAAYMAADERMEAEEWAYLSAHQRAADEGCPQCLRYGLAAYDHGGHPTRLRRLAEAIGAITEKQKDSPKLQRSVELLFPVDDAEFMLEAAVRLPAPLNELVSVALLRKSFAERRGALARTGDAEIRRRLLARIVATAANARDAQGCEAVESTLQLLASEPVRYGTPVDTQALDGALCRCLNIGQPFERGFGMRLGTNDAPACHGACRLYNWALERNLACVRPTGA